MLYFSSMNPIHKHPAGLTAAAANGLGGAVIVQKDWERRYLRYFVALGAGFMLGTAFLEMLPESIALTGPKAPLLMLVGYFLFTSSNTPLPGTSILAKRRTEEVGGHRRDSVLFGLVIHTFFDGIAIASGFLISGWLGWIIFLAVILHKIPEGFTITSVSLPQAAAAQNPGAASALLGAGTFAGVLAMALTRHGVDVGLPISAGVTITLLPATIRSQKVNREQGVAMPLLVFAGVALMKCLDLAFHVHCSPDGQPVFAGQSLFPLHPIKIKCPMTLPNTVLRSAGILGRASLFPLPRLR